MDENSIREAAIAQAAAEYGSGKPKRSKARVLRELLGTSPTLEQLRIYTAAYDEEIYSQACDWWERTFGDFSPKRNPDF